MANSLEDSATILQALFGDRKPTEEVLLHRVGMLGLTKDMVTALNRDLARSFKIKTSDASLASQTNCVVFVIRMLKAMNLPLRGFDIALTAKQHPSIGARAAELV